MGTACNMDNKEYNFNNFQRLKAAVQNY